jgi:LmbE family N-acetylglucosaminyl deacetylase
VEYGEPTWGRVSPAELASIAVAPAMVPVDPDVDRKRKAIWCYTSQIAPLERDHGLTERIDANVPEQFWRLVPPPRGWERLADA